MVSYNIYNYSLTFVVYLVPDAQLFELLLVTGEQVLQGLLVLDVLLLGKDLGGHGVRLEVDVNFFGVKYSTTPSRGIATIVGLKCMYSIYLLGKELGSLASQLGSLARLAGIIGY